MVLSMNAGTEMLDAISQTLVGFCEQTNGFKQEPVIGRLASKEPAKKLRNFRGNLNVCPRLLEQCLQSFCLRIYRLG